MNRPHGPSRLVRLLAFAALLAAIVAGSEAIAPPRAAVAQPGPAYTLERVVVAPQLDGILGVVHAGDGSGRLFLVRQLGQVYIVQNGARLATPFLDATDFLGTAAGEQGLLGIAFHPAYASNGRFFIAYSGRRPSEAECNGDIQPMNTFAEVRVSATNPNLADPSTRRVILEICDFASNHNGGGLAFGPDRFLYIGTGDGGGSYDPRANGQDRSVLLGKILRIDVDGTDPGLQYRIPSSNPFVGQAGIRAEIWAYGLRNPWRLTFDRATGDLWIADVGQDRREEINFQPASDAGGRNYGWDVLEGTLCHEPPNGCASLAFGMTAPVVEYAHDAAGGCSITGGYVYRGAAYGVLRGRYFYGDFCSGRIWSLPPGSFTPKEELVATVGVTTFGEDEAGELYVADSGGADAGVYRLAARPMVGGDANGDGALTSVDALCILRQTGGFAASAPCPLPLAFGDISRNGVVDATDALCVLRRIGGFASTPNCPNP